MILARKLLNRNAFELWNFLLFLIQTNMFQTILENFTGSIDNVNFLFINIVDVEIGIENQSLKLKASNCRDKSSCNTVT